MASRMKEDEKNEKIIRGLLKLPANRRCINCNSLGPQYVCTNFWTFVCTNCSGIHREFTHRVKSVSMAKFTSQEVSALQAGGNERAKEIYFKEWDSQRQSVPDSSNVERLRDFIKHVYVDRRYTGERSTVRPPRMQGGREDYNENRKADAYRGGSRSPPYEDTYERRYNERPSPGGRNEDRNFRYNYDERRSPGYDQEIRRYGDSGRSPGHFEADDRLQEDRVGNGNQNRRSEEHRSADVAYKPESRSPNNQKDMSSPPMVRSVREILGEDVPPLRVGDPPKANGDKAADVPARTQRSASSSSMGSADGNSADQKRVNLGTLIDFSDDPQPAAAATPNDLFAAQSVQQTTPDLFAAQSVQQTTPDLFAAQSVQQTTPDLFAAQSVQQTTPDLFAAQSVQQTTPSVDGGNWASFDLAPQEKSTQPPSNASTLESALSQLALGSQPVVNQSTFPVGGVDSFVKTSVGGQWPSTQQHQPSLFTTADSQSVAQQYSPFAGAPSNQQWSSSVVPNLQGPSTVTPKTPQENSAGGPLQPVNVETKPSGRKELPEGLFSGAVPVPGWQRGPPRGMGFVMHYPAVMSMPAFPQPVQSTNPFDITSEPTIPHASSFPSMTSLQRAQPNMGAPPDLMRASNFSTPSPQWMPPQPQAPSYITSQMPPGGYMMQQAPTNILPLGHQGVGGFASVGPIYGSVSADQHLGPRFPQPASPNSLSTVGGNPFG